jgi:hypothetical protein
MSKKNVVPLSARKVWCGVVWCGCAILESAVDISHNPGRAIPDWPKLLHLYSRLRPGKTVFEWMQDHDVRSIGIDVRRFASFGVIKARLSLPPRTKKSVCDPRGAKSHIRRRASYAAYIGGQFS